MLKIKIIDINTLEGWKELSKRSHASILISRGIEPSEENLAKFQEKVNQEVKEFEVKHPHKPTPIYHCVGTRMFKTEEEAKKYKKHREYRRQLEKKAEELLKMIGHIRYNEFIDNVHIARELYLKERDRAKNDLSWILGAIYQVGKIEGIRQERKRKRTKNDKLKYENLTFIKLEVS